MKKIEIIIRPECLEKMRDALAKIQIHGMNCTNIYGFGRQQGHTEVYRGTVVHVDFVQKVKIEIVIDDIHAEQVIETVLSCAQTGRVGDGKIFIQTIDDAVRIRTGERGSSAL